MLAYRALVLHRLILARGPHAQAENVAGLVPGLVEALAVVVLRTAGRGCLVAHGASLNCTCNLRAASSALVPRRSTQQRAHISLKTLESSPNLRQQLKYILDPNI